MPITWKIDSFSSVGERIQLRGWCFSSESPVSKVEAKFVQPLFTATLSSFGLPSPDVAAGLDPTATHHRFDEWIDVPKALAGRDFRFQFTLGDGTVHIGGSALENYNSNRIAEPGPTAIRPIEVGSPPVAPDVGSLRAELDALLRREAQYRARIASEFGDRGEGNSFVHVLREQIAALREGEQRTFAQLESLVRDLESKERKASQLESELGHHRGQTLWRLLGSRLAARRTSSPR